MLDKSTLRASMLERRDASSAEWRAAASREIAKNAAVLLRELLQHKVQQKMQQFDAAVPLSEIVAGYWPIRSEADPRPSMQEAAVLGHSIALPVLNRESLVFHSFTFGDRLISAPFGTSRPLPEAVASKPGVLLVPLAAFDRAGARLGWGRGYYDRAISQLRNEAVLKLAVGVAFGFQEVNGLPMEPHDQFLDAIATESELIRVLPVG